MRFLPIGFFAAAFLFEGCATIVQGTSQVVAIHSNVRGADVIVNGATVGKTPYVGPIRRGSSTTVRLEKDGYEPKTIVLNTEIEPIFFGNIIFPGFLGTTTDFATQSMFKYAPETIDVDLIADSPAK